MGSITKNYLAQEIIQEITERAFGKGTMESFQELEGGFCNAVYRICLRDKREAILKVAPADRKVGGLLREINSIKGEKFGHFCVPELQYEVWFDAFYHMISRVIQDGIDAGKEP